MKKLIAVTGVIALTFGWFAFAAGGSAQDAQVGAYVSVHTDTWTVANNLATNVATLTSTSGIDIGKGGAVAVVLSALTAGQTITGGNLRCYVFMPVQAVTVDGGSQPAMAWIPYSALDFAPQTGNQFAASGDKQILTGVGRIVWVPDAITVSAGATITTTLSRRNGLPVSGGI